MIVHPAMTAPDRIWQRLMRGVEYIERHIEEDLNLAGIASMAALSEYHFHRLFRANFGVPVIDYVRRRRLSRAASALLRSRTPVLQIALAAGFESQAAFSRAFRRVYHVPPAHFRNRGRDVPWLSSAPLTEATLAMLPGLGQEQPRLEMIEPFAVAGLTARFDGPTRANIPQLWADLAATVGQGRLAAVDCIGISENDEAVLSGELGFMAAIPLSPGQAVPAGLTSRTLAGGNYLVFTVKNASQNMSAAYDYIFGTWMPGSHHRLAPLPSFSRTSPRDERSGGGTAQIWIPVLGT